MARPTLYRITPFDAALGTTIKFSWTGRRQQANVAVITDTSENVVYSKVYISYVSEHVIPPDSGLVNGQQYNISIIVIDIDEDISGVDNYDDYDSFKDQLTHPSDLSYSEILRCYTTPTFEFEGYPVATQAKVIQDSSISLSLSYEQAENEPLNTWTSYLCDATKTVLQQSSLNYAANTLYSWFSGLDDTTTYYIHAIGETIHGMPVDTGYVEIYTNYTLPGQFINLDVKNIKENGTIHVASYAVSQTGHANTEPVEYVYDGSTPPKAYAANLTNNFVRFDESLNINKDFTLLVRAKDVRIINKTDYETALRLPESGIGEGENTLGETLLYNAFLLLTDTTTGHRYSFTLWRTDKEFQVFMYCNYPGDEISLWSNPITFDGFTLDEDALDVGAFASTGLLLAVQRKDGQFNIKALSY